MSIRDAAWKRLIQQEVVRRNGGAYSRCRRIDIYKQLGVPVIWRYVGGTVQIYRLQDGEYMLSDRSPSFPLVSAMIINQFLQQAETQDDTTFIRTWRQWVRQQVSSEPA